MTDPRLLSLRARLALHPPEPAPLEPDVAQASVALVVRPDADDLEILLIRRAELEGDPWSGHMALPGGRWSKADVDGRATAIRESLEEVGVDLRSPGAYLGPLVEVTPRAGAPRIAISAHVFAVPAGTGTTINHEVAEALWVPLRRLAEPGAATEYIHSMSGGEPLRFPAIGYQEYVIWGLTHRILTRFLEIAHDPVAEEGRRE